MTPLTNFRIEAGSEPTTARKKLATIWTRLVVSEERIRHAWACTCKFVIWRIRCFHQGRFISFLCDALSLGCTWCFLTNHAAAWRQCVFFFFRHNNPPAWIIFLLARTSSSRCGRVVVMYELCCTIHGVQLAWESSDMSMVFDSVGNRDDAALLDSYQYWPAPVNNLMPVRPWYTRN